MTTQREQKLIDIMFEIAQASRNLPATTDRETHMAWVADQLRKNGFDTQPCGLSWGILKQDGT